MTLPLVKILSARKTPTVTQWWIDWSGTKLGPFLLERDACRRAADMVQIVYADTPGAPRVQPWQEMVDWLGSSFEDAKDTSRLVGACRAAQDALLLTLASQPWSELAAADALMHAGQWLAPIIGDRQDVVTDGVTARLVVEDTTIELRCVLADREFKLVTRGEG